MLLLIVFIDLLLFFSYSLAAAVSMFESLEGFHNVNTQLFTSIRGRGSNRIDPLSTPLVFIHWMCGEHHVWGGWCVGNTMCGEGGVWGTPCVGRVVCGEHHVLGGWCVGTPCVGSTMCGEGGVWGTPCVGRVVCGEHHVLGGWCVGTPCVHLH